MIGCLCLHGFTGGPYEIEPVTDYLSQNTDWVLSIPTYPGHGTKLSLKGITHIEWLEAAEKAYLELRKKSRSDLYCRVFNGRDDRRISRIKIRLRQIDFIKRKCVLFKSRPDDQRYSRYDDHRVKRRIKGS